MFASWSCGLPRRSGEARHELVHVQPVWEAAPFVMSRGKPDRGVVRVDLAREAQRGLEEVASLVSIVNDGIVSLAEALNFSTFAALRLSASITAGPWSIL